MGGWFNSERSNSFIYLRLCKGTLQKCRRYDSAADADLLLAYLSQLPKSSFESCIPTRGTKVPDRPEWIHEIKHDGYRLIVQRDGKRVRLFTRNGHDWSDRFPLISEAALRSRNSNFVIEAVLLGVDGCSDFNGLRSHKHDDEVQFYAFDMLVSDGDDLRKLPLTMRKTNLARRVTSSRAISGPTCFGIPA